MVVTVNEGKLRPGQAAPEDGSVNVVTAINMALAHALSSDPNVLVFGEDVGVKGGVFCATLGLQKRFGPRRVFDTPLCEQLIAGMAVGLGVDGFRAVAEFQFLGFSLPGFDQIVNHASRMRNRTRGRFSCPVVFRAPCGGERQSPEHHSENFEALYAQIPGLRVVIPSSPRRAYGLLLAAIADPDPVIFLEPIRLYRNLSIKELVADDGVSLPLDRCFMLREGCDITLITWGASVLEAYVVAERFAEEGVEIEIIDVASIRYLDIDTIARSVRKTGRCLIVHEAQRICGFAGEIVASLLEAGIPLSPLNFRRVTGYDTIVPLGRLAKQYLPTEERITEAVHALLSS